jgi:cupin fold WbuC family metalloprotein
MEKIYSKIEPSVLLHLIYRLKDVEGRTNIAPDTEFLQLASIKMHKGQTFKPHKHILLEKKTNIAQESWLVIKGAVKCILYDLDDKIIAEPVLYPGDCSMTFRGGHNYLILEEDTIVYEYKTGPYMGQQLDKEFLETED